MVFYHQSLLNVFEIIRTKLINKNHNDPLARYFGIMKTQKLIAWKYY